MDTISRESLVELAGVRTDHCVSIFLPTHRVGPDTRRFAPEDVIRWKNLLRNADVRLSALGVAQRDVRALLEPAHALDEDALFWQYQGDGLAAFAAPGLFRTFRVPLRLDELTVVARRFHLKPLLPLLAGDGRFYVLALSQNEVRVIEATRDTAGEVDLATAPASLREALRFDDPERQLQYHTTGPRAGGRQPAIFHGHGVGTDDRKNNVLRFCQQIDRGLAPLLREVSAPLVLAGVEALAAIYRQASTYPHLVEAVVPGNPEDLRASELRARAWPLVEPVMQAARRAAIDRYHAARGTSKATDDLVETLRAAAEGRIDVLFVTVGVQRWGGLDHRHQRAVRHESRQPGDEDLLNVVAVDALLAGSTVYAGRSDAMPDGHAVSALLRY